MATADEPPAAAPAVPAAPAPHHETADEIYPEKEYSARGSLELGGNVSFEWMADEIVFDFGPSFGWFFTERFELSLLPAVEYVRVEEADGSHTSTTTGSVVLEPSYHHPIQTDVLYVFGGLGVGYDYDGTKSELELVPRVGMNIAVGRSGMLSPALRAPILIGNNSGPMDADFGVDAGFTLEIGFSTFF